MSWVEEQPLIIIANKTDTAIVRIKEDFPHYTWAGVVTYYWHNMTAHILGVLRAPTFKERQLLRIHFITQGIQGVEFERHSGANPRRTAIRFRRGMG